jgi:hypothetical protein
MVANVFDLSWNNPSDTMDVSVNRMVVRSTWSLYSLGDGPMSFYKVDDTTSTWQLETKLERNTVGSRNLGESMCEVVCDNPGTTYKFQGWWLDNVQRYCNKRGWILERIV